MDYKELLISLASTILTIFGTVFAYHKYIIGYVDKRKEETERDIDRLSEQLKELKISSDTRDNEIKGLIKELKIDISQSIETMRKDLKEDFKYLRDRECKGVKK